MATFAAPARAADHGFYAGIDLGRAILPDLGGGDAELNDITLTNTSVDQSDTSWAARIGFRFSPYFAMELGYIDLGESTAKFANATAPADATVTYGVRGPTVAFIPSYAFGRWEPFLKAALLWQDVDAEVSGTLPAPTGSFRFGASEDGMKYFWGTGVRYNFSDHWHAKFELNWYGHLGDEEPTGEGNVLAASFGAAYRF
jgi:OOP family OmpA-OmpF porin